MSVVIGLALMLLIGLAGPGCAGLASAAMAPPLASTADDAPNDVGAQPLPARLTWAPEHLPLAVVVDPSAIEYSALLEEAVAWWEVRVPGLLCACGELPSALTGGSIVGVSAEALPPNEAGELAGLATWYQTEGRITGGKVVLQRGLRAELRLHTLAHELGHILGLPHDEPGNSVMAPQADGSPFVLPTTTENRLRAMYPRRS